MNSLTGKVYDFDFFGIISLNEIMEFNLKLFLKILKSTQLLTDIQIHFILGRIRSKKKKPFKEQYAG